MIWVALGAMLVSIVSFYAGSANVRAILRQNARDRDLLVNQLCNLAGNPWQPPPAKDEPPAEPWTPEDYVLSPEHEPEY